MIGKLMQWIGEGLRRIYPVPVTDCDDPVGSICRDALQDNRAATFANKKAARDSIVAMQNWLLSRQIGPGSHDSYR